MHNISLRQNFCSMMRYMFSVEYVLGFVVLPLFTGLRFVSSPSEHYTANQATQHVVHILLVSLTEPNKQPLSLW